MNEDYKKGAEDLQKIVQEYFKNVLGLPCPDFLFNLSQNDRKN